MGQSVSSGPFLFLKVKFDCYSQRHLPTRECYSKRAPKVIKIQPHRTFVFRKIMTTRISLLLIAFLLPGFVFEAKAETVFFHVERNQENDFGLNLTSIGALGLDPGSIGHIDLSYIESVNEGDGVVLDFGGGVTYDLGVTLFMSMGFIFGYNYDNKDGIASYYPEVGAIARLTKTFGLVASARRYKNLYNGVDDEDMVMFGLLIGSN